MKTALRVAALFAVYSSIGYGAEWVVGVLGAEPDPAEAPVAPVVEVAVEPDVVVEVRPTIVSRVHVRHAGHCDYTRESELVVPVDDGGTLAIRAGSGELSVEGREGLEEVVVVGFACASREEYLDELGVSAEATTEGDVVVVAHYPSERGGNGGHGTARLDLTVLVPMGLGVEIEDSSGDMEVSGTGQLRIDDSSGSIQVSDVSGDLRIEDSSGEVGVAGVTGDVEIEDGSGEIDVTDVGGSVLVRDGSGEIDLARIERDVRVVSDGSGSIEVRDVGGDFVVDRDGSGGIRHSGVQGRVDVPSRSRRGG